MATAGEDVSEPIVTTVQHEVHSIRGIDVSFPFPPYQCQILYMNKVIQALQEVINTFST